NRPRIGEVVPASAAEAAGFRVGDVILAADGDSVRSFEELMQIVRLSSNKPIRFEVQRAEDKIALIATPRRQVIEDPLTGSKSQLGVLGLASSKLQEDRVLVRFNPYTAFLESFRQTGEI